MTYTATPTRAPIDEQTMSLLDLIDSDPVHERDRERICHEIEAAARAASGVIDPNELRARLSDRNGDLVVHPRSVGGVIQGLAKRGVLTFVGFVPTTGSKSGNNGRPARVYRLADLSGLR